MKVIVDDKIPFIKGRIELIADTVVYKAGNRITAEDVRDADAMIVRTRTRCNESLLKDSSVKLVVTATIGFDHLDTEWLEKAGIEWHNCPGCNAPSVRQYVHNSLLTLGIRPKCAGVIGVGHVGSLVADDLEAMGTRVLRCDPYVEGCNATMEDIAAECDFITFHTPLIRGGETPTFHLADENFFASLKHSPLLMNSSRGEVVDTEALIKALQTGQVRDAIIDTWEGEPNINLQLLRMVCIGTPHIAGYSADGKATATRMSLEHICRYQGIIPPDKVLASPFAEGRIPQTDEEALTLYDPLRDSAALKAAPHSAEQLRGNYPVRRELITI